MNLAELVQEAQNLSDEDLQTSELLGFLNDAVAKINIECKANFPFFSINESSSPYLGFPDKWQRALLIPFTVGRIKQKDSSQFEYVDAYGEFLANLMEFKSQYAIPEEYKDESLNKYFIDDLSQSHWRW